MMIVSLPNGTIIHKVNANEFMETDAPLTSIIEYADKSDVVETAPNGKIFGTRRIGANKGVGDKEKPEEELPPKEGFQDASTSQYMKFLKEGLRRAEPYLDQLS
ncbi:Selenoprotein N [Mizuhopecten yessoensis]|uniref:Selenoprotein N n=3 Tax=Mizuhopecten yessoensis TaxID=6573 RepID=A0A210PXF4_MIZYE|nr:Selenoprotein N [Mizuhopecten yessoensis]